MKPWSELTPSERDALIAEKVMGWKRMTWYEYDKQNPRSAHRNKELTPYWHPVSDPYTDTSLKLAEDSIDYYYPESAWSPSTDIAAAWEVKNTFTDYKDCAKFTRALYSQVRGRVGMLSESYLILHVTPADICLAALKAVGVEV